ncbi:MAG TPA: BlaI/MecI/CopY family transcriptional regulator [Terriglobales bacterium]|nr:BlaI/MecI/CopY family transcriptional regulator [Terriglobales bacterium]
MFNITHKRAKPLSELEHLVMDFVWSHDRCSAEQIRESLAAARPMKDSTVRTILSRLERKGYVSHTVEGRTYLYCSTQPRQSVAVRAVQQVIDRFCAGSVEQLLSGMVEGKLIDRREVEKLVRRVAQEKRGNKSS